MKTGPKTMSLEAHFLLNLERQDGSDCILWRGRVTGVKSLPQLAKRREDGTVVYYSVRSLAYRYLLHKDPTKSGRINNLCGNPKCVFHLGSSTDKAEEIRRRWAQHLEHKPYTTSMEKLGKEFHCTRQRIEQIVNEGVRE